MKKILVVIALVMLNICQLPAQELIACGPFYSEPHEVTVEANITLQPFVEQTVGMRSNSTRTDVTAIKWIDRITNMPTYLRDFYDLYGNKVHEVLNGKQNWTADPALADYNESNNSYYITLTTIKGTVDFTFSRDASAEVIKQSCRNAVQEVCKSQYADADSFIRYLIIALSYDYPEAFWLRNYFRWGDYYSWQYNYSQTSGKGTAEYSQRIYFVLKADDFDRRLDFLDDAILVYSAVTDITEKVNGIISESPDGSRYDKVAYLNDWLTHHNCYNPEYSATPDNMKHHVVWSPYSAFMGLSDADGPVCEAYARAFKILCDKLNIPCVLASGYAKGNKLQAQGESHVWNETQMDDGQWYAVDVTWNDPVVKSKQEKISGFENHNWLLLGKKDLVANDFTFEESHPLSITWDNKPEIMDKWDCLIESLIADYKYRNSTGIRTAAYHPSDKVQLYNMQGQKVDAEYKGFVLSNGRKYIAK